MIMSTKQQPVSERVWSGAEKFADAVTSRATEIADQVGEVARERADELAELATDRAEGTTRMTRRRRSRTLKVAVLAGIVGAVITYLAGRSRSHPHRAGYANPS